MTTRNCLPAKILKAEISQVPRAPTHTQHTRIHAYTHVHSHTHTHQNLENGPLENKVTNPFHQAVAQPRFCSKHTSLILLVLNTNLFSGGQFLKSTPKELGPPSSSPSSRSYTTPHDGMGRVGACTGPFHLAARYCPFCIIRLCYRATGRGAEQKRKARRKQRPLPIGWVFALGTKEVRAIQPCNYCQD